MFDNAAANFASNAGTHPLAWSCVCSPIFRLEDLPKSFVGRSGFSGHCVAKGQLPMSKLRWSWQVGTRMMPAPLWRCHNAWRPAGVAPRSLGGWCAKIIPVVDLPGHRLLDRDVLALVAGRFTEGGSAERWGRPPPAAQRTEWRSAHRPGCRRSVRPCPECHAPAASRSVSGSCGARGQPAHRHSPRPSPRGGPRSRSHEYSIRARSRRKPLIWNFICSVPFSNLAPLMRNCLLHHFLLLPICKKLLSQSLAALAHRAADIDSVRLALVLRKPSRLVGCEVDKTRFVPLDKLLEKPAHRGTPLRRYAPAKSGV